MSVGAEGTSISPPHKMQEGMTSPPNPTSRALLPTSATTEHIVRARDGFGNTFSLWKEGLPNLVFLKSVVYPCRCV